MEMNMPVAPYGYNNGLFGGNNDLLGFVYLAMIFGWGGNGFGFGGRGAGSGVLATDNLISNEFNFNTLNNGIRGLEQGVCKLGYEGSQLASQTRESIANSTFALKDAITSLGTQSASCCCETNRNIDSLKYELAKGFCDVINSNAMNTRSIMENTNNGVQRILDTIVGNQMQDLRDKNSALTLQVSQAAQTANIINSIKPCPMPAYIVQNPNCNGF